MNSRHASSEWVVIATAGFVIALTPFAIDMYLPALPLMAAQLHSSGGAMQTTVTAYLLGLSMGPLLMGPLSDRIGRRKVGLGGLVLFVAASVVCFFATSADQLIAARFVQAIGGGGASVAAQSMLSDRLSGARLARANSLAFLTLSVAPIVAPLAGAEILLGTGWRVIFLCLAGLGAAAMLAQAMLDDGKSSETIAQRRESTLGAFAAILANREAVGLIVALASTAVAFFAFIAASPFLFIERLAWSERSYSLALLTMAAMAAGFNVASAATVRRVGAATILRLAVAGLGLVGLWTLACGLVRAGGPAIFCGLVGMMALLHLVVANATSRLLDLFPTRRGAAAALAATARSSAGVIGSLLVAGMGVGAVSLGLTIAGASVVAGIGLAIGWRDCGGAKAES